MFRFIKPLVTGGIFTVLLILLSACTEDYTSTQETGYKDPARDFTLGKFLPDPLKSHTGTVNYGADYGGGADSRAFISVFSINTTNYACIVVDHDITLKNSFQSRLCFTIPSSTLPLDTPVNICASSPTAKIRTAGSATYDRIYNSETCGLTATFSSPVTSFIDISWGGTITIGGTVLDPALLTRVPRI